MSDGIAGFVDAAARAARARVDLSSATAYAHEVMVCGPSTGHHWRTIAMCESTERAIVVAEALRAIAQTKESPP